MSGSSHGDKREHDVSENKANTNERALTADEKHSCKEGHQYTRNEKGICQNLEIHGRAVGEKALGPDHQKRNHRFNPEANGIFDELDSIFLFHCK